MSERRKLLLAAMGVLCLLDACQSSGARLANIRTNRLESDLGRLARTAGAHYASTHPKDSMFVWYVFAGRHGSAVPPITAEQRETQKRIVGSFATGAAGIVIDTLTALNRDGVELTAVEIHNDSGFVDIFRAFPASAGRFEFVDDRYAFSRRAGQWVFAERIRLGAGSAIPQ